MVLRNVDLDQFHAFIDSPIGQNCIEKYVGVCDNSVGAVFPVFIVLFFTWPFIVLAAYSVISRMSSSRRKKQVIYWPCSCLLWLQSG